MAQAQSAKPEALEDYTHKLTSHAGLVISGNVTKGHRSDGSLINGEYQAITNIDAVTEQSTSLTWNLTYPTNDRGHGVAPYSAGSFKISVYSWSNGAPPKGFNAWERPSHEFYEGLKSGKATPLEFDGYLSAGTIQKAAEEYLTVLVNEKKVRVLALRGKTPKAGDFWFLDNKDFPTLLKSESPIMDFFISSFDDAKFGAKDLVSQLQQKGSASSHAIQFAFNAADLSAASKPLLDAVAAYLKSDASVRLAIEGHTHDIGGASFNLDLSRKRAESVKTYLVQTGGIAASRLTASGFGLTNPVANNTTPEGRALNRRVVFREVKAGAAPK